MPDNRRKLDTSRPYGRCYGYGPVGYEQDGLLFDRAGRELVDPNHKPQPYAPPASADAPAPQVAGPFADFDVDNATGKQLDGAHMLLTGKGFKPGTSVDERRAIVRGLISGEQGPQEGEAA